MMYVIVYGPLPTIVVAFVPINIVQRPTFFYHLVRMGKCGPKMSENSKQIHSGGIKKWGHFQSKLYHFSNFNKINVCDNSVTHKLYNLIIKNQQ